MLALLVRSTLIGLFTAALILVAVPDLRSGLFSVSSLPDFDEVQQPELVSFSYAVKRASPAVVNIYTRNYVRGDRLQLNTQGLGSGVIMSAKGYVVTNYHVVAKADQVIVALQDGRIFTAQMVGKDQRTDLAVLKVPAENLPVIPVNQDYQPTVGDTVLAIGNPYNLGQTTTYGIISATGRTGMSFYGRQDFLQTDAAINRGNSGGALVNSRGELVGINTASFQQATDLETYGISFAIPYRLTEKIMNKLIADGRVIRGYIGIDGRDVNPVMARLLDAEQQRGVMVADMDKGGPAEKAGIQPQDLIIKINDKPVKGARGAMDIVTDARPGTTLSITLIRDGESLTLPVTVGNEPDSGQ
ncbi:MULTISPECIES: outer membrane-stress sensor serine endopeptidase DegS [unclassified Salinivibrio]|uniref:outer membrane-stress sensor serine endopeptidase DegS n=1 Tax=unclassified Salinivibrio TaxID=2636825 RepID=UPI0009847D3F|nr:MULTISPECIES: outer membrane-stress sensor serine endopeptidase DegS [unclassified Salinivibrio]OOF15136.1 outer membrane-stress sensor serine endopeptidase DegS [Salinivibrio sp. PR919]OOF18485.1 outer membrane-stress sensor serine endopeptidase DegS [Salinivibrio sp. PR932]